MSAGGAGTSGAVPKANDVFLADYFGRTELVCLPHLGPGSFGLTPQGDDPSASRDQDTITAETERRSGRVAGRPQ